MQTPNAYPPIRARDTSDTVKPDEKDIEQYFRKRCKKRGWLCLKFVSPGNDGVPDREILADFNLTFRAEFKKPGKKPTPLQKFRHKQFARLGHRVFVVDSFELADQLYQLISDTVENARRAVR